MIRQRGKSERICVAVPAAVLMIVDHVLLGKTTIISTQKAGRIWDAKEDANRKQIRITEKALKDNF